MVDRSEDVADDAVISFKLGEFFNSDNVIFDEMMKNEILDDVLAGILDDIKQGRSETVRKTDGHPQKAEHNAPQQQCFSNITNEELDELALKTHKNKTYKQTTWGVKVFRGIIFS